VKIENYIVIVFAIIAPKRFSTMVQDLNVKTKATGRNYSGNTSWVRIFWIRMQKHREQKQNFKKRLISN
jgi:hypothetical protein